MALKGQAPDSAKKGASAAGSSGSPDTKTVKLPAPTLTGNEFEDNDVLGKHELLLEMVQGCVEDSRLIMPCYREYKKNAQSLRVEAAIGASASQ
eukprot:8292421-Pyramimonas_sp.AAC.1